MRDAKPRSVIAIGVQAPLSVFKFKIGLGGRGVFCISRLPSPVQHLARSVAEVTHTGKCHRNTVLVGSGNYFFVANRTAGLDNAFNPCRARIV